MSSALHSLRTHLRRVLRSERGMALPTVMIAVVASSALAAAAITTSVGAQRGAVRDQNSKEALAAAEAGVNEALLHYNRVRTTAPNVCLSGTTTIATGTVGANGWCAPQTRTMAATTNTYTYSVKPTGGELEIVSTGNVDGVTRRVDVLARSSGGLQPFGEMSVVGLNSISLNSNGQITANVGTNGNITMNSNAVIDCEAAQIGIGRQVLTNSNAHMNCTPTQGSLSLPPVNPGDVWTNNSNSRICVQDVIISNKKAITCPTGSTIPWNRTARTITLNSNDYLTLGAPGGTYNYSLCQITLNSNTAIYIAAGSTVRIYFASPEQCGQGSGVTQLQMNSNSVIESTGSTPSHLAMMFVGSDTRQTRINLNSNATSNQACTNDFVIYAPRTDVNFNSNAHYCGAIAGKSVFMNSNASITASAAAADFVLPNTVAHHFVTEEFIECTATNASTTPNSGC